MLLCFLLIWVASYKGDKEIVELLIENNANINEKDREGSTALMIGNNKSNNYK